MNYKIPAWKWKREDSTFKKCYFYRTHDYYFLIGLLTTEVKSYFSQVPVYLVYDTVINSMEHAVINVSLTGRNPSF